MESLRRALELIEDAAAKSPARDLATRVLQHVAKEGSSVLEEFLRLRTITEQYQFVTKLALAREFDTSSLHGLRHCKSDSTATEAREKGNAMFEKGWYPGALTEYNRSIRYAETKEALALGFGRRSAVLFKTGRHVEALRDINSSLEHGYPEGIAFKLYLCKAKILFYQGDLDAARSACQAGIDLVPEDAAPSWKLEFEQLGKKIAAGRPFKQLIEPRSASEMMRETVRRNLEDVGAHFSPHKSYPSASSSLELRFTKDKGRSFFATESIRPGGYGGGGGDSEPRDFSRLLIIMLFSIFFFHS